MKNSNPETAELNRARQAYLELRYKAAISYRELLICAATYAPALALVLDLLIVHNPVNPA